MLFASRHFASILPITGNHSRFAISSAVCAIALSRDLLPLIWEHIRFTGFHIVDNCRAFRRLLWAGNPCVHSLWHDPEVTTGLRCRFGACVINLTFACWKSRPLYEASPFDSPCAHFPGEFVLSGSVLLRFVLRASHKSVTRYARQSRDALNGESGGFKPQSIDIALPVALNPFSVNVYHDSPFEFMDFMNCFAAILSILKFLQRPSKKSSYGSLFFGLELLSITFANFSLQSLYNLKVRFHEALPPIFVLEIFIPFQPCT